MRLGGHFSSLRFLCRDLSTFETLELGNAFLVVLLAMNKKMMREREGGGGGGRRERG